MPNDFIAVPEDFRYSSIPVLVVLPSEAGSLMEVPNDFTALPENCRHSDICRDCHLKQGR